MSIGFFIIGGIIFALYMYFTLWNIVYSNKKQKEENYPNLPNSDESKLDKRLENIFTKSEDKKE
jgi:ABC-type sugar transport system permease subunit